VAQKSGKERPAHTKPEGQGRKRGRPPKSIDRDDVAHAVARLFAEGGFEAVSIERTAREMGVSRATLYRTVPSKGHLLGILFEQMTQDLRAGAVAATKDDGRSAEERLHALIRVHIEAAVRMRHYLFVFFGDGWLAPEQYANWRRWRRSYERIWTDTVTSAIDAGALRADDPVVATRLILGMCVWVARWYRPNDGHSSEDVADEAIRLLARGD